MKDIAFKVGMGYLRHALTGAGGAMVAAGTINNQQETAILGGILALVGALWSHFENRNNAITKQ